MSFLQDKSQTDPNLRVKSKRELKGGWGVESKTGDTYEPFQWFRKPDIRIGHFAWITIDIEYTTKTPDFTLQKI